MSEKNEETASGLDKAKMKMVLAVAVIVIPAIAAGAFGLGIVDIGDAGSESPEDSAETEGSPEAGGEPNVVVSEIVEDPPGEPNEEDVVFENTGGGTADMSGWTVSDEADQTYTFPDGFTLEPGESVTLNVESGTDTESDLYWGSGNPIWNNGGDTVVLRDTQGRVVAEESY